MSHTAPATQGSSRFGVRFGARSGLRSGTRRDPQAGVTLVEVLVVLALVGVMAGTVALSVGNGGRGDVAGQEADLLVARLNRAADEVILSGEPMRFDWTAEGYGFSVSQDGAWQPHPVALLAEPHALPARIGFGPQSGSALLTGTMRLQSGEVLSLDLMRDGTRVEQVTFDGINAARAGLGT